MTRRQSICFFYLLYLGLFSCSASAQEYTGIETQINIGIGYEFLDYEEKLPENYLASDVDVSNVILRVEGLKRWQNLFAGIQGVAPVARDNSRETWLANNSLDQSDSLKYGLYRLSAFTGYAFSPFFNPVIGLRSTWSEQRRSDFRDKTGVPLYSAEITEEVMAHYISLGFRGVLRLSGNWEASYGAEYNLPLYSKVENTGLPGWEAKNLDGYLWNVSGALTYALRTNMSLGLNFCFGRLYWEGSGWQIYGNGQVKWPENQTDFFSSLLTMKLIFQ